MWLVFTLITFFCWGGADLFYKIGADEGEKCSHLKTSAAVGLVMGAAALVTWATRVPEYNPLNLVRYLPVSAMYILSMTVGYFGLRYLEVSVSSPVQNASGAVSALLMILLLHQLPDTLTLIAIVPITLGVVALGIAERRKAAASLEGGEKRFSFGLTAFLFPVAYCILDSIGTFLDALYLEDITATPLLGVTEETLEDTANISYQLTFLLCALGILLYLGLIRKEKFFTRGTPPRFAAAGLETLGQLAYVYAISGNGVAAAPVVASYCVASLVLGRIFLKEKLTPFQYAAVGLVFAGILLMGIAEGLAG